jgi:hypothetical protein
MILRKLRVRLSAGRWTDVTPSWCESSWLLIIRKGALCPVPGARCPVPGALCPVPCALCPVPWALCTSNERCATFVATVCCNCDRISHAQTRTISIMYIRLNVKPDAHGFFLCILYFIILAVHVSGAICTHHQERRLQSSAVGTCDCYGVLGVGQSIGHTHAHTHTHSAVIWPDRAVSVSVSVSMDCPTANTPFTLRLPK